MHVFRANWEQKASLYIKVDGFRTNWYKSKTYIKANVSLANWEQKARREVKVDEVRTNWNKSKTYQGERILSNLGTKSKTLSQGARIQSQLRTKGKPVYQDG